MATDLSTRSCLVGLSGFKEELEKLRKAPKICTLHELQLKKQTAGKCCFVECLGFSCMQLCANGMV